jgi:hypothetical protein
MPDTKTAYRLRDAQAARRETPSTFDAPPLAVVTELEPGQNVKVCAEFDLKQRLGDAKDTRHIPVLKGERFWVRIGTSTRLPDDTVTYRGFVANGLLYSDNHGLDYGDEIEFSPEHIYQIEP